MRAGTQPIMMTANDTAAMLGVSLRTVRQLVKDGELEPRFIGNGRKEYRISYESALAWSESLPREKQIAS